VFWDVGRYAVLHPLHAFAWTKQRGVFVKNRLSDGVIIAVLLAGAVLVDIFFLVHFVNLTSNAFLLLLSMLTPLIVGVELSIVLSSWRKRLSPGAVGIVSAIVGIVLLTDLIVYIGPLFTHGQTGHDSMPQFASTLSTPNATATATPAIPGPITFVFHSSPGEGMTTGNAVLGVTQQETIVLSLQHFHTNNGPDLHIFLSRVAMPQTHDDVYNGIDLGPLQATDGDKNYLVPNNTDITQFKSVVIYCVSYSAFFGYASA
jgi:hypothetical protein